MSNITEGFIHELHNFDAKIPSEKKDLVSFRPLISTESPSGSKMVIYKNNLEEERADQVNSYSPQKKEYADQSQQFISTRIQQIDERTRQSTDIIRNLDERTEKLGKKSENLDKMIGKFDDQLGAILEMIKMFNPEIRTLDSLPSTNQL